MRVVVLLSVCVRSSWPTSSAYGIGKPSNLIFPSDESYLLIWINKREISREITFTMTLGYLIGPVLGGKLSEDLSWRVGVDMFQNWRVLNTNFMSKSSVSG